MRILKLFMNWKMSQNATQLLHNIGDGQCFKPYPLNNGDRTLEFLMFTPHIIKSHVRVQILQSENE
ncbi:hypothetical protein T02_14194 [Trichinella nativa]|uniref:Uncharacterized protein n=1 Tax=Trichinella nativa TaxID=6335 RepID=A0A0V1KLW5_9BILA|nr:hypothetical protein T02_15656 [Trichinella nativa]KRZ60979.1 hypothetical protein T02_14194 [Trichinella nativa]